MRIPAWLQDGWSIFFALVGISIFVTLTSPATFGFMNYTQWGGMYDDHWCHALAYSFNPDLGVEVSFQEFAAGADAYRRVFSAPSHNKMTCTVWARTFCGQLAKDGWKITWVKPKLQSELYLGTKNVCDLTLPGTERWYFHVAP